MTARLAMKLLRKRARMIGQYDEAQRLLSSSRAKPTMGTYDRLIELKGDISSVEEHLRQSGHSWPRKENEHEFHE